MNVVFPRVCRGPYSVSEAWNHSWPSSWSREWQPCWRMIQGTCSTSGEEWGAERVQSNEVWSSWVPPAFPLTPEHWDAREFVHFLLNCLSWFWELETHSVHNTKERNLGILRNAVGTYRTKHIGCKEGAAWLTVGPEMQLQTLRSDRSWDIFTWLSTRGKTYIKGARPGRGGHKNILPLQVMGSVTILPSALRGKGSRMQHVNKCMHCVLTSPTVIVNLM